MAGKVKFDRDATFKQIIGADREPEVDSQETVSYTHLTLPTN